MSSTWLRDSGVAFLPKSVQNFLSTFIYGNYNQALYINYWSLFHGMTGIIFGCILWYYGVKRNYWLWYGLIAHTIWEIWQMISGWSYPLRATGNSNVTDTIVDTLFFLTGVKLVSYITN